MDYVAKRRQIAPDRMFGIDEAYEHSVEGWVALIYPDDRTMMSEYFRNEVLVQDQTFNKEYRIIRHDNHAERWVHGLGKLKFDTQGRPPEDVRHDSRHHRPQEGGEKPRRYPRKSQEGCGHDNPGLGVRCRDKRPLYIRSPDPVSGPCPCHCRGDGIIPR